MSPLRYIVQKTSAVVSLTSILLLAACSTPDTPVEIHDPFEVQNRRAHEANRDLDRVFFRPASNVYGTVFPEPVRNGVGNFASNVNLPGLVFNNLLQGNVEDAGHNTFRFLINTTLGIGGLFNPAKDFGLDERSTDFGETLTVWGAPEGAYIELPIAGPSTERAAIGKVVDLFTNPLSFATPSPEKYVGTAASVASSFGDRYRYSDTIDSILYESADSYAQARQIYLQNRRFELGVDAPEGVIDPFEEIYGE